MADQGSGTYGPGNAGNGMDDGFIAELARYSTILEPALERYLPGGGGWADEVVEGMRYSLLAPGKRLRPLLAMVSAELAGGTAEGVIEAACALEMIHTASLILDDLPCMDDATLRRGRQTLHCRTDEATAVLAADALLMQAFGLLGAAFSRSSLRPAEIGALLEDAADCVGVPGMIGGQWRDLHPGEPSFECLEYIHSHKTGMLFMLSATLGARLSRAPKDMVDALRTYAKNLGLAFQITDDILNSQGSVSETGKDVRTDKGKVTFVTAFSIDHARTVAGELIETAKASLEYFGDRAGILYQLSDFVFRRRK